MRRSIRRVVLGVCAVALATAAVLGYVGRGTRPGRTSAQARSVWRPWCPRTSRRRRRRAGFAAFAAGRFNNNSPSTATHLNLTISFTDGAAAAANVSDRARSARSSTARRSRRPALRRSSFSSVSCSFPNLAGGHFAKVQFPFTPVAPTPLTVGSTVKATLSATYGEGNGGANDSQTAAPDTLKISGAGKCTTGGSKLDPISNSSQTSSIGVDYPAAATEPAPSVHGGGDRRQQHAGHAWAASPATRDARAAAGGRVRDCSARRHASAGRRRR